MIRLSVGCPWNRTESFPSHTPARTYQLWRASLRHPHHIFKEFSFISSYPTCYIFVGFGVGVGIVPEAFSCPFLSSGYQRKNSHLALQSGLMNHEPPWVMVSSNGTNPNCSLGCSRTTDPDKVFIGSPDHRPHHGPRKHLASIFPSSSMDSDSNKISGCSTDHG